MVEDEKRWPGGGEALSAHVDGRFLYVGATLSGCHRSVFEVPVI